MTSRADIAKGKGLKSQEPVSTVNVETRTIILPNVRRMCAILLFFIGSFTVGFGAGFGTGYASKACEVV